ncbi:hypothetical protein SBRY_10209 [Actinacidiphila bryophytorum]|uniref:Uncharacterized protein n=1 Tax=Actinacidiphila bryophytorum TaxID=1436133 RepID=A0A9W4E5W9_9ACTN|nr:hypothetical protein SBRY_10209 [Actinacidiphila bryophytorum]
MGASLDMTGSFRVGERSDLWERSHRRTEHVPDRQGGGTRGRSRGFAGTVRAPADGRTPPAVRTRLVLRTVDNSNACGRTTALRRSRQRDPAVPHCSEGGG